MWCIAEESLWYAGDPRVLFGDILRLSPLDQLGRGTKRKHR